MYRTLLDPEGPSAQGGGTQRKVPTYRTKTGVTRLTWPKYFNFGSYWKRYSQFYTTITLPYYCKQL